MTRYYFISLFFFIVGLAQAANILTESFNADPGYDSPTWTESVGSGSTVDEDSTEQLLPGGGAQSLKLDKVSPNFNARTERALASNQLITYTTFWFKITASSLANGEVILLWESRSSTPTGFLFVFLRHGVSGHFLRFSVLNNGVNTTSDTADIDLDVWHRVDIKYDFTNSAFEFRLNGVSEYSGALTGTVGINTRTIRIGDATNVKAVTTHFDYVIINDDAYDTLETPTPTPTPTASPTDTATPTPTATPGTWYVRPQTSYELDPDGEYGLENGTSYENAFDGLPDLLASHAAIAASPAPRTLYLCGTHYYQEDFTTQSQWDTALDSNGLTIRFDYPGDSGNIIGARRVLAADFEDQEDGTWKGQVALGIQDTQVINVVLGDPRYDADAPTDPLSGRSYMHSSRLLKRVTTLNLQDRTSDPNMFDWTLSGSGTGEYYVRYYSGTNPDLLAKPALGVNIDLVAAAEGTVGALAAGEWGYGDEDSLGYDTIYVRLSDDSDPDGHNVNNYIQALYGKAELPLYDGAFWFSDATEADQLYVNPYDSDPPGDAFYNWLGAAFDCNGRSNITFEGGDGHGGFYFGESGVLKLSQQDAQEPTNININNLHFAYSPKSFLFCADNNREIFGSEDIHMDNVEVFECAAGTYPAHGVSGTQHRNWSVLNSWFHARDEIARPIYVATYADRHQIGGQTIQDFLIQDCEIGPAPGDGIFTWLGSDGTADRTTINRVYIHDLNDDKLLNDHRAIQLGGAGNTDQGNRSKNWVIKDTIVFRAGGNKSNSNGVGCGARMKWGGTSLADSPLFINCLFVDCNYSFFWEFNSVENKVAGRVYNCISRDVLSGGYHIYLRNAADLTDFKSNTNCFYPDGSFHYGAAGDSADLADWRTESGEDAQAFTDDPLNVDDTFDDPTDGKIQALSPCLGAGVNISGANRLTDYFLNPVQVGTPDVGIHELSAPVAGKVSPGSIYLLFFFEIF